jgi:hypothetical protein
VARTEVVTKAAMCRGRHPECDPEETASGTWQLHGNTLTSDGILNGTISSFDCKTMVCYIENAIKPGDRLTYTLEKNNTENQ